VLVIWEQIYRRENKVKVLKRGKMKIKNKKEKEEKSKKRMKKMKRKKEVRTLFQDYTQRNMWNYFLEQAGTKKGYMRNKTLAFAEQFETKKCYMRNKTLASVEQVGTKKMLHEKQNFSVRGTSRNKKQAI
jgi:hypothetical protein